MYDWKQVLVPQSTSIFEAMQVIDSGRLQVALVVDEATRLLGVVTDGDLRRAILKRMSMDAPVEQIMKRQPEVAALTESKEDIIAKMRALEIRHMPVVDAANVVVGLEILEELLFKPEHDNWVVLMAGGLGERLIPLTQTCPKPMLKIDDKPILELIIKNFIEFGFKKFYIAINYKGDILQNYFEDGRQWGATIRYIHEDSKLGTAGALSLLDETLDKPIIVMNADLLTKVDFRKLLRFHKEHQSKATMCVREYDFQVPYGVVNIQDNKIVSISEKPMQQFFVNAGIYVLEPDLLPLIPKNTNYDMPTFFEKLTQQQHHCSVFPIKEYWIDIGCATELERARAEYPTAFATKETV